jgi:hypothetical protein
MCSLDTIVEQTTKKGNKMKKIWNYLTSKEILGFYGQIENLCYNEGHDVDEGINRLYELDLKEVKNPVEFISQWIEHILPKELERREIFYVCPKN